ncbi:DNA-binding transcriptional regulator, GntR family [Cognatiyoonia koreensis]|uniref:DNA-binding transcriptional regulator, GntR family n=1 Tax=Cognatiyoonia koreensis TaxID=364200 RepID=A0A1I0RJE5_9RHOB|nr:GntR family transcriptional regulator [Cognatiyoonia koreensis]SEW40398.1 DNA-binding transcriptional regulator, GntR family [Cognatiyoonia koreensis]
MDAVKPKKTLVEETYDILTDAICTGEFAPGERLNQDEIAAKLNVSRQPVNSAISILKANGLVEDTGRRSVVVTRFDRDLFRAIYDYRTVIEPFAVKLAGQHLTSADRKLADKVLRAGEKALTSNKLGQLVRADMMFHEMIYAWSRNQVIETSMRNNWHHIRRSMAEVLRDPSAIVPVWQQHREIVEALFDNRPDEAARIMQSHIGSSYESIISAMENPH